MSNVPTIIKKRENQVDLSLSLSLLDFILLCFIFKTELELFNTALLLNYLEM